MEQKTTTAGTKDLNQVLLNLNEEGKFAISVLTDEQGLSIAAACQDGMDADRQAAVVAMIQRNIMQAGKRLSLEQAEELSLFTVDGQRLVVRFFNTDQHNLILAVLIPGKNQNYRRITTKAITDIQRILKSYWE